MDASVSAEGQTSEIQMYQRSGAGTYQMVVLREQIKLRGRTSHGHKYTVNGGRASGVPNTGCGASWLNIVALVDTLNSMGLVLERDYRIIVNGDDSVVAIRIEVHDGMLSEFA